jgi:hypothetical protein
MAEIGLDLTQEFPKPLTTAVVQAADVVITMGCGDACPIFPGTRYLDWQLDNPLVRASTRSARSATRSTDAYGHCWLSWYRPVSSEVTASRPSQQQHPPAHCIDAMANRAAGAQRSHQGWVTPTIAPVLSGLG